MNKTELAQMIDQTLLSPLVTKEEVSDFCKKAREYGFASVCINPVYVPLAHSLLSGSNTLTCTVVDFPLGAGGKEAKISQAKEVISKGADEVDFVVDLGLVKSHNWTTLTQELTEIHKAVKDAEKLRDDKTLPPVKDKLIIETCFLTDEEKIQTCLCAKKAGFDFVKTSTGFASVKPNGANETDVALMRKTVGNEMGVKASGGIHSTQEALALIKAGASRLGASAGVAIVDGLE